MPNEQLVAVTMMVELEGADTEDVDLLTRQLLSEIRELDVESANLVTRGSAPLGAKVVDPISIGAIAVAVLPTVLPKLIEFLQAWVLRGQGRTMKFKGRMGNQNVEFEGTLEDFKALLNTMPTSQKTVRSKRLRTSKSKHNQS